MIVIIDNGGAFVYNLYQYFGEMDRHTAVIRGDEAVVQELEKIAPTPLYCRLDRVCRKMWNLQASAGCLHLRIPILGIGFGHRNRQIYRTRSYRLRIAHGKTTSSITAAAGFHGSKPRLK